VAEQVRLLIIPLKESADAGAIKERLKAGESFEALARELSSDPQLRDSGGELGWFPRAALTPQFAQAAFDELDVGEASEPIAMGDQTVVIMVAERAAARQVDGASLARLKARALDEWVNAEYQHTKVEFHGFRNGYDSQTDAWVKWQLQKMTKVSPGGER
jgi:parvulin-like peptidyl-prolyl isomerase